MKLDVERFNWNNHFHGFKSKKNIVKIAIDESAGETKVYEKSDTYYRPFSFYTHFLLSCYFIKHPSLF